MKGLLASLFCLFPSAPPPTPDITPPLPPEIILHIISFLPLCSLRHVTLVSKAFRALSLPYLFRHLELKHKNYKSLHDVISGNEGYRRFVRTLRMQQEPASLYDHCTTWEELVHFAGMVPQVSALEIITFYKAEGSDVIPLPKMENLCRLKIVILTRSEIDAHLLLPHLHYSRGLKILNLRRTILRPSQETPFTFALESLTLHQAVCTNALDLFQASQYTLTHLSIDDISFSRSAKDMFDLVMLFKRQLRELRIEFFNHVEFSVVKLDLRQLPVLKILKWWEFRIDGALLYGAPSLLGCTGLEELSIFKLGVQTLPGTPSMRLRRISLYGHRHRYDVETCIALFSSSKPSLRSLMMDGCFNAPADYLFLVQSICTTRTAVRMVAYAQDKGVEEVVSKSDIRFLSIKGATDTVELRGESKVEYLHLTQEHPVKAILLPNLRVLYLDCVSPNQKVGEIDARITLVRGVEDEAEQRWKSAVEEMQDSMCWDDDLGKLTV
ncbi:hypothetical protein BT69DRAFT_96935 [Atractiella rhizophila]|nr:hypothetical protein BT69DRAFT_96935 [Atractiella rhizophila]